MPRDYKMYINGEWPGGHAALEEFTELRWISMQRTRRQYPF